jgi:hypothetical protein
VKQYLLLLFKNYPSTPLNVPPNVPDVGCLFVVWLDNNCVVVVGCGASELPPVVKEKINFDDKLLAVA